MQSSFFFPADTGGFSVLDAWPVLVIIIVGGTALLIAKKIFFD